MARHAVGRTIKRLREAKGWTQQALAERVEWRSTQSFAHHAAVLLIGSRNVFGMRRLDYCTT
jgi:transcriptional regulator with XRE-family HTH domain